MEQAEPGLTAGRRARLMFVANGVSLVGSISSAMALPWLILDKTGDPVALSEVGFVALLPLAAATLVGGYLADRGVRLRVVSVACDVIAAGIFFGIFLAIRADALSPGLLAALLFLSSCAAAAGGVSRMTVFSQLVTEAGWNRDRANAQYAMVMRGAALVAPVVTGGLLAVHSLPLIIALDATSYGVSALLIFLGAGDARMPRVSQRPVQGPAVTERPDWRGLITWVLAVGLVNIGVNASLRVLLPLKAVPGHHVFGYSVAVLALGIGTTAGAYSYGRIAPHVARLRRLRLAPVLALMIAGVGFALFGVGASPAVWAVALGGIGFVAGVMGPGLMTIVVETAPAALRGRVISSIEIAINLGSAFATLSLGPLASAGPAAPSMSLAAGMICLAMLFLVLPGRPAPPRPIVTVPPGPAS